MKVIKSLLLGSAAGLLAVAGAQAADLPSRKAAPVEYVRVCSAYGAGFFYIPGTDTCLKFGGRIRAEYAYVTPLKRSEAIDGYRTRFQFDVDSRTQSAYGTVRTFARFRAEGDSGRPYGDVSNDRFTLINGFVQFAGITAGLVNNFFEFYADNLNWGGISNPDSYGANPIALAYTATFGSGFSATIALQDPTQVNKKAGGYTAAGISMPDIVGVLRVDQGWGSAQLSGVVHQMRTNNIYGATGQFVDTEYGFGIQGGVEINLPMLAAGDQLWLQAAYVEGARYYLDAYGYSKAGISSISLDYADGVIDGNGNLKKTKGYTFLVALLHYWAPTVRQSIFATYEDVNYGSSVTTPAATLASAKGGYTDVKSFDIGTNVIWSPVKNLDLGVEVLYHRVDPKGRVYDANKNNGATIGSDDSIEARLRIQKDF